MNYRVKNGRRDGRKKTNEAEAREIVALIRACMHQPEYDGKTFGVIPLLGDENDQAKLIQSMLCAQIEPRDIESRKILCGPPPAFQGDERDVIFLSMVDSREPLHEGPIRLLGYGSGDSRRQRYNVAASRARDQLWVVNSLDGANDLKGADIRKGLLDYASNPRASIAKEQEIERKSDSPFELAVCKALVSRGFKIVQQWEVGAYRIDMVAVCCDRRVAIECDGERWHSGEAKIKEDMERQAILERIGWRFVRVRGSEYYRDPESSINRIVDELSALNIQPTFESDTDADVSAGQSDLLDRVKADACRILCPDDLKEEEGSVVDFEPLEKRVAIEGSHEVSESKYGEDSSGGLFELCAMSSPLPGEGKMEASTTTTEDKTPMISGSPRRESVSSQEPVGGSRKKKEPKKAKKGKESRSAKSNNTTEHPHVNDQKSRSEPNKGGSHSGIPAEEKSDVSLLEALAESGLEYLDKRGTGGALWIVGGQEIKAQVLAIAKGRAFFRFKKGGGKATGFRDAWWWKPTKK